MTTVLSSSQPPIIIRRGTYTERNTFLTIPYQTFEVENAYLLPSQYDFKGRTYNTLSYKDTAVELKDIPILTPPMRVQRYDQAKSILYLEVDNEQFIQKFSKFQDHLTSTFVRHNNILTNPHTNHDVKVWLKKDGIINQSKVDYVFQLLLRENVLSIFVNQNMHVNTMDREIKTVASLKPGMQVRCLLRLFNILNLCPIDSINNYQQHQQHQQQTRMFFRIHHSVPSIWTIS